MTTLAIIPSNNSCLVSSRKRKRASELHVHFCTQPQDVVYTYSQSDYDRSGLFPDTKDQEKKQQFFFAVSINFVQATPTYHEQQPDEMPSLKKKKSKFNSNRPKLSIDTSNLHGPLYFTDMTTNHQKQKDSLPLLLEEDPIDLVTKENTRRNSLPLVIC